MISIICPSRDRPNELKTALDSVDLAKNGLEALVWLDNDDPQLKKYHELFDNNPNVRLFIKDRVGYIKFHLMLNFLSSQAKYDWVFEFNDDIYMVNDNWFEIFKDFAKQFEPKTQPIVINLWGQGETVANLFPIVSRAYFETLGHFALTPNCDDWVRIVAIGAGISHDLKGIKPKHRKYKGAENPLKDQTYREVEWDRRKHWKVWNERRGILPKDLLDADINKLKNYQKDHKAT